MRPERVIVELGIARTVEVVGCQPVADHLGDGVSRIGIRRVDVDGVGQLRGDLVAVRVGPDGHCRYARYQHAGQLGLGPGPFAIDAALDGLDAVDLLEDVLDYVDHANSSDMADSIMSLTVGRLSYSAGRIMGLGCCANLGIHSLTPLGSLSSPNTPL